MRLGIIAVKNSRPLIQPSNASMVSLFGSLFRCFVYIYFGHLSSTARRRNRPNCELDLSMYNLRHGTSYPVYMCYNIFCSCLPGAFQFELLLWGY